MKNMKIAVSGKGGVGKTVIAGVLAEFFVHAGFRVLAIDADSAPNLALTLGIPIDQANNIKPISERWHYLIRIILRTCLKSLIFITIK